MIITYNFDQIVPEVSHEVMLGIKSTYSDVWGETPVFSWMTLGKAFNL